MAWHRAIPLVVVPCQIGIIEQQAGPLSTEMESGHSWVCFFRDGAVGEGADGREQPLQQGLLDELTGDNSELVGSGHTAPTPESKAEVADASRDDQYSGSTSCSTCFCSYSGRQGAPGSGAGPSGAVLGEDGDHRKSGPRKGATSLDGDGVGVSGGNGGHHAVHASNSEDEADSWIRVTAAGRTGSLGQSSNSSCVVEFNRWDRRPSSQPGYGWGGGLRRNHVAAAAGAADRAETDRAFWETCLASGYP